MKYSKKVMELFRNPKNVGRMKNPDGVGKVGNPLCGDLMELYIKVKNRKGRHIIDKISFLSFGCVAAISTSSMVTEMAKGKTLEDALKITKDDVRKSVGELPPVKYHCSVLAVSALREAIYDYMKKHNLPVSEEMESYHRAAVRTREMIEHKTGGR